MNYQQTILAFVEGRIPFDEFHALVINDNDFAEWIDQHAPENWHCYTKPSKENDFKVEPLPFSIRHKFHEFSDGKALESVGYKLDVHGQMLAFIQQVWPEMKVHPDGTLQQQYRLLLSACPSYIDGNEVWESGLMERILSECPEEWSKARKVKHIKERLVDEFHLDGKHYPHWLQNPDWPFSGGMPMKYVETTVKHKGEWIQHHFCDPQTGEERIIDDML